MTKTHKYKTNQRLKFGNNGSVEPGRKWKGSGLEGRSAANVDQREPLKEAAIVKRLRRFSFDENSHTLP
jgi:hypothetical protein